MLKLLKTESRKLLRAFLHPTFLYLIIVGNAFLILSVLTVYHFEHDLNPKMKSFMDCLWWGVSTITTVGFGDVVPLTFPGRIIGIILMYTGTVLFVSFIGILASRWTHEKVEEDLRPIEKEVKKEENIQLQLEKKLEQIIKRIDKIEGK